MNKNTISAFSAATGATSNGTPERSNTPDPAIEQEQVRANQPDRFVRRPEVCHLTSIPSSSLTDLIRKGEFPAPFKLSERMAAWRLSEVMGWMNSRQKAV
ncbi:MAG: hypothetical protein CSA81_14370 [Acidobacteria bacterium]|nr:MAG: hypothetical protein CSA81_14370 [Acidobacteriota bacterium]